MKQSKRMACLLTAGSRNWAFIALIAAFFIGIIMGSIFNYNADESSRGLLIQFAESIFNRQAIDRTVVNALAINFTYFFLIFVSGLAAPGFIIVMFLPFVKGFSFGYTTAFIFSIFGSRGILVCALGILPQALLSSLAIILASRLAVNYSLAIVRCLKGATMKDFNFNKYMVFISVMFLVSVSTVVFDAFVTPAVLNMFSG